jgi:hypothetical protein
MSSVPDFGKVSIDNFGLFLAHQATEWQRKDRLHLSITRSNKSSLCLNECFGSYSHVAPINADNNNIMVVVRNASGNRSVPQIEAVDQAASDVPIFTVALHAEHREHIMLHMFIRLL